MTATAGGLTANYSLTNLAGLPKSIAVAATNGGSGQSAQILTGFANQLEAIVKDSGGNPISGVLVTFTAPTTVGAPGGTFTGNASTATITTGATGIAISPVFTANGTVSPSGTPYNVTVTVNSNTSLTASFSLTNLSGPPTQIAATAGSGQSIGINTLFGTSLQATVKDAGGNLASGVAVTFTAPASGASGTFTGGVTTATVNTNGSGVASAPITANAIGGAYTVTATFAGGPTVNFSLTNNAGPAASITATGGATQSAQINTAFTTLQATVTDAGGNLVNGAIVTFTITAASNGASGKFGSATTVQATTLNGVANAPTLTANLTVGGPFTVKATVTGVSTAATYSLTNTQGAPSTMAATSGTPQSVQGGLGPVTALKVLVKDVGGNVLNNQTVTFTAPSTGASGTFAGGAVTTTATTDSTGTATMPAFTANFTLGAYTVTATLNSLTASFSLTNIPGPPASITATSGTPQSVAINGSFAALVATVKDAGGNPVGAGITVTFTAPATAGAPGVTAGTTTATTTASGVATSPVLTANGTKGGPYTVTATSGSATSASYSLTNLAGPPSSITAVAGTNNQATQNTQAFPTPLAVTVTDAGGDLLSGVVVTFSAPTSTTVPSGTFAGSGTSATATTGANGVAIAPVLTANGKLGVFTVTVTAPGANNTTVSMSPAFSLTNQSGPPATATPGTGTSGQSQTVNVAFGTALSATLKDAGGNLAAGYAVTFTAGSNAGGASGTFSTGGTVAHVTSNASGVAQAPAFTANTVTGSYTVTMTVDVAPAVSAIYTLTNNPGTAAKITAIAGTPQNVAVTTNATAMQASVTDQYGNLVGSGVSVTFTAPTTGASGKFGSNSSAAQTTNASGVVTAPAFTANNIVGPYNVTATISGATSATFALTNTAGPAATIVASASSTGQSQNAGQAFANALAAVVKDSFGNLVTGQLVVFTAPGSGASGTFPGSVITVTVNTDATGTATAPAFTANATAGGPYNVTATINGLTANFALTNKPGQAANIAPVAGTTPQSAQLTVAFSPALAVKVTDTGGNPVSGLTVTFTAVPNNGASGTFANNSATVTATTQASGVATATAFTPNLVLGSYSVSATTVNSLSTSFALTNIPGPPKTMTATGGGGQSAQILTHRLLMCSWQR